MVGESIDRISWAHAAGLPVCLLGPSMRGRQIIDNALAEQNLTVTPHVETDSIDALFAHAATGHWATIVSDRWMRASGHGGPLRTVPLCAPEITCPVVLLRRSPFPCPSVRWPTPLPVLRPDRSGRSPAPASAERQFTVPSAVRYAFREGQFHGKC
jgi:DNA-binding transcriptional LysR family regulator